MAVFGMVLERQGRRLQGGEWASRCVSPPARPQLGPAIRATTWLVALFPALAALVSIYGLVANPGDVAKGAQSLSGMLPPSAVSLVGDELAQFVSASSKSLGLGAIIGIVIALWSGVRGMTSMITALNIAYNQPEGRGLFRFNATALLLTIVVRGGRLRRDSVSVPLSGSSAGWVHRVSLPGPHAGRA
jgi:hypothetical protein